MKLVTFCALPVTHVSAHLLTVDACKSSLHRLLRWGTFWSSLATLELVWDIRAANVLLISDEDGGEVVTRVL